MGKRSNKGIQSPVNFQPPHATCHNTPKSVLGVCCHKVWAAIKEELGKGQEVSYLSSPGKGMVLSIIVSVLAWQSDPKRFLSLQSFEGFLQDGHPCSWIQSPSPTWITDLSRDCRSCQVLFLLELEIISSLRRCLSSSSPCTLGRGGTILEVHFLTD